MITRHTLAGKGSKAGLCLAERWLRMQTCRERFEEALLDKSGGLSAGFRCAALCHGKHV